MDSKCKNFALKSPCTLLDSIQNLIKFPKNITLSSILLSLSIITYSLLQKSRVTLLYEWYARLKRHLPIDSKCKNFTWNRGTHCSVRMVWFQSKQEADRTRISFFKNGIGSDSKKRLSGRLSDILLFFLIFVDFSLLWCMFKV